MTLKDTQTKFTFFLPDARVLSEAEIATLQSAKDQATGTDKREGVWLEIHCPDGSCVRDDGRITIPAIGTGSTEKKGTWLNLFCPEGSCELIESTDLP